MGPDLLLDVCSFLFQFLHLLPDLVWIDVVAGQLREFPVDLLIEIRQESFLLPVPLRLLSGCHAGDLVLIKLLFLVRENELPALGADPTG